MGLFDCKGKDDNEVHVSAPCFLEDEYNLRKWSTAWQQTAWSRNCVNRYAKSTTLEGNITKIYLYIVSFDPLKPHFYIVKLGFNGVHIIFLISGQNIDCGYSLEPPCRGCSNEYPQSMFWTEIWKISEFFYLKIFSFWRWNFLYTVKPVLKAPCI